MGEETKQTKYHARGMDEIRQALLAADAETQYDEKAKRVLGNKIILAHILVNVVDEFQGMAPEDVVPYIEGEPFISAVPVEPGLTNAARKQGQRITGMNTEHAEIGEGLVRFDIIFYVRMKDGISQMIVNVEAQKDKPSGYRLLGVLLSGELSAAGKFKIMEDEYNIKIDDRMREDVSEMCNLGRGVFEAGEAYGEARGIEKGVARIIIKMYKNGFTLEQIADVTEKTIEEVEAAVAEQESVL